MLGESVMENNLKWYCVKLKDGTHMLVWFVKNEEDADIVAKAHIIRHRLDLKYDVDSIFEISGYHDPVFIGVKNILLANN